MAGSYTTIQGDMFDTVAYKTYGHEGYASYIRAANPEHRDVYIFSSGIVLAIPDIDKSKTASGLPPWKR